MGTHLRILSESYPINTNMTGLDGFQKCSLDESRLGIGIVTVPLIELLKEYVFGHLCL